MVEHLNGGRRVVDGGGEGADGDVDQHAQGERRILLDRALDAECETVGQAPFGDLRKGQGRVRFEHDRPARDEVADAVGQHDHRVVAGRPLEQPFVVDRLNRAGLLAAHLERRLTRQERLELRIVSGALGGRDPNRRAQRCAPRSGDELGDLDGPEPVQRTVEEDEEEQRARTP